MSCTVCLPLTPAAVWGGDVGPVGSLGCRACRVTDSRASRKPRTPSPPPNSYVNATSAPRSLHKRVLRARACEGLGNSTVDGDLHLHERHFGPSAGRHIVYKGELVGC